MSPTPTTPALLEWVSVDEHLPPQKVEVALLGIKHGHETTATGQLWCLYASGKPCWAVSHTDPFDVLYWHPLAPRPALFTTITAALAS